MSALLEIKNLHACVADKKILNGLNLAIAAGEVHALMGPNGSGKSTLASVLMGHPGYQVTGGAVEFDGNNLLAMKPEERARLGLFLAFQYPVAIPGLTVEHFLRTALNTKLQFQGAKSLSPKDFRAAVEAELKLLKFKPELLERSLNDGFSGGEKKRLEILQLAVLKPKLAILDETDSGLDVDALKIAAEGVNNLLSSGMSVFVITHYQRLLHYLKPSHVHVMLDGNIVRSGGDELVQEIESKGYQV
jgi:Fe-S cluster assembly ATP-binding protein